MVKMFNVTPVKQLHFNIYLKLPLCLEAEPGIATSMTVDS